jgi:single-strand DNA-binding protein
MASDINHVNIIGRLTRDPELKSTNNGIHFCRFNIASNRSVYNKQSGESRDEVGFFECVAWSGKGEAIQKYLTKGSRIAIDGHLKWSSWEGSDGKKQSKVEIAVDEFQFLDTKKDGQSMHEPEGRRVQHASGAGTFDSGALADDDIPF